MSSDVNSVAARPDVAVEWPEGDFPDQSSGPRTTLMPGISVFLLPVAIAQLWKPIPMKDGRRYLHNGQPNPTFDQQVERLQLKCDRNNPLVVFGGPHDGEPMTAAWTNNPRPRPWGKRDDPKTPWISDLAYLLGVGLASAARPATPELLKAEITKYAGKPVRLRHGLTAQCRPDKVRYILVKTAEGEASIPDPTGKKGCGARYYTKDFKDPQSGQYEAEIMCDCGKPKPEEQAAGVQEATVLLRGFENVDEIMPPIGVVK